MNRGYYMAARRYEIYLDSLQSLQQLLLLKMQSAKLSFILVFLKLSKLEDSRGFLFRLDHKKGPIYILLNVFYTEWY